MDEFILVADEDVLPHGVVGLNQVQIHAVEKVFPSFQQGVGFCQKGAHQLAGGGVAGINDQCQLLDLFAFPAFQRLDERQVAVHRKAVGVEVQIELVRVQLYLLAQDAEPAQKVLVAAAAAVGGFYLLLQGIGTVPGFLIPQVQLCLHPLPDLLPRFLGQRRGHLLGLVRRILRAVERLQRPGRRGAGKRHPRPREAHHRPLQVSARGGICRRTAENHQRQDPPR